MAAIFRKLMGVNGFDMINDEDWGAVKIIACNTWPNIEFAFDSTDAWSSLKNGKTLIYDDGGMVAMYCAWFGDGEDVYEGFQGSLVDVNEMLKHNEIMENKNLV
jgi:hypothetical protein